jgi:hypothetical protein
MLTAVSAAVLCVCGKTTIDVKVVLVEVFMFTEKTPSLIITISSITTSLKVLIIVVQLLLRYT